MEHRAEVDSFFRSDPGSPFRRDTAAEYHGLRWYPVDPHFCVLSRLYRYADPETVVVKGTKGEDRREFRYGYFEFVLPDTDRTPLPVKLNVYKFTPYDGQRYLLYRDNLSVWFTDRTTGNETYGVGRYVDLGRRCTNRATSTGSISTRHTTPTAPIATCTRARSQEKKTISTWRCVPGN